MASKGCNLTVFLVKRKQPKSESWKIPIMGEFLDGLTNCCVTAGKYMSSVSAVVLCGMCIFISSPSKSALYGLVTPTLNRKVSPFFMTLTS